MKHSYLKFLLVSGVAMVCLAMSLTVYAQAKTGPINDPTNDGPPAGAILDLGGTAIPHSYQQHTVNFTATLPSTFISFAMREDPAFILLDDVSVVDVTHPSGNLIVNGGFESGPVGANAPASWTYLNSFGASYAGVVANGAGLAHSGANYYFDGAVQAYDGITQFISTSVGDTYQISFWLSDNSALTTFSDLSNNGDVSDIGGNGADLLVYAGAVPTVPEQTSTIVLFLGSLCLLAYGRVRVLGQSAS